MAKSKRQRRKEAQANRERLNASSKITASPAPIMAGRADDSRKKEADNHAKDNAEQSANSNHWTRKAYSMSGFLSLLFIGIVGLSFLGIAIACWQKGGYENIRTALWWGIGAYIFIGIGLVFAYKDYVIKPAKEPPPSIIKDRPELLFAAETDPFIIGKPVTIRSVVTNAGKVTAYRVNVRTGFYYLPKNVKRSLQYRENDNGVQQAIPEAVPPGGPYVGLVVVAREVMTEKRIAAINDGSVILFWLVKGEYEDANSNKYPVRHCFMYVKDMGGMTICPKEYWPIENEASK
jgi:hypothetical protein